MTRCNCQAVVELYSLLVDLRERPENQHNEPDSDSKHNNPSSETLVWELDTAGPDTFTVWTGSADVLVHNLERELDADGNCRITNDDQSIVIIRPDRTADYIDPDEIEYKNVRIDNEGEVQFSDDEQKNPIFEHSGGAKRSPSLTERPDKLGYDSDGGLFYRNFDDIYTDRVEHVLQHKTEITCQTKTILLTQHSQKESTRYKLSTKHGITK